jgi:hypothetical protein
MVSRQRQNLKMNSSFESVPFYCAMLLPKRIVVYLHAICAEIAKKSIYTVSNNYWSSTTNADNADNAWIVNFNNGNDNWNNKNNNNYVRCVR